jgi:hypothetical protein
LLGRDRPDEAGELARAGDDDLLLWFAAAGHSLPALVEALLAAPGALDDDGVLAALAAGELVADRRPAARVPGRLDQQSADVAVADLGDRPLPALVAGGVLRGDKSDEAINSSALLKRSKSPISATSASAVSVSIPRRQRKDATSRRHGSSSAVSRSARSSASIRASTRSTVCR